MNEATGHADGATASVSGRVQRVPIVVVPGIMGTRLQDKNGKLVWNPRGQLGTSWSNPNPIPGWLLSGQDLGPLDCDVARLQNIIPLTPAADEFPADHPNYKNSIRIGNFSNLIYEFYGDLVVKLAVDLAPRIAPKDPSVFFAGYDWRQDNAISADRLEEVVNFALKQCDTDKVILVAHSQGGLVSRYYCKEKHGEDKLLALFLIGSPSLGAPLPYMWLKNGMPMSSVADAFIRLHLLMAYTQRGSRDILRCFPSGYQLCPSISYVNATPDWLTFDPRNTGGGTTKFTDCSSPDLYTDAYTGFCEDAAETARCAPHITTATRFHAKLMDKNGNVYMPYDKTYAILTNDMDTVIGVDLPRGPNPNMGDTKLRSLAAGDGSVPSVSAAALKSTNGRFKGTTTLSGEMHGKMASSKQCTDFLLDTIPKILPK